MSVHDDDAALPKINAHTKQSWPHIRNDHSAGGVAYRRLQPGNVEIALIATHGGDRWQMPKGSVEADETSVAAAIREVEEETGLQTVNEGFLKTIDYWYWDTYRKPMPELVHKAVDFYLLRVTGGELSDRSYEVDAVTWYTIDDALDVLTFGGERDVVQLARGMLRAS